jgi:roadblock/LC7 domain-containing protein
MKSNQQIASKSNQWLSYNKFTLQKAVELFELKTVESEHFFAEVVPQIPSPFLAETLQENIPLGLAIGTEKAKSELIIMPVLVEVRRLLHKKISLFSGIEFNVEPRLGLKGICDFLISKSEEQYVLRSPVIAIVEAKKGEIEVGMGQCTAEMVAAQKFNAKHNNPIEPVYGIVTTGSRWKFLKLTHQTLFIQSDETSIEQIERILGLFIKMISG